MWTVGLILLVLSVIDIKNRMIPVWVLGLSGVCVFLYHIVCRQQNVWLILGGAGVGGMFCLISKLTGEKFGYGDSIGIMILGVYLGFWKLVEVLVGAFVLLAMVSVFLLAVKRMSKKSAVPFYPFLTGGYLLMVLSEGGIL